MNIVIGGSITVIIVLAFAAALYAAIFVAGGLAHLKSIALHRRLRRDFRFEKKASLLPSRSYARGTIDGFDVFVCSERVDGSRCFQVRLEGDRFLAPPLEIIKCEISKGGELRCTGYVEKPDSIPFGSEDFAEINASAGGTVLDGGLREDLILLGLRAKSYAAFDDFFVVNLPAMTTPVKTAVDTILLTARIATRLRAAARKDDLVLHLLNRRARLLLTPPERLKCLRLLKRLYRENPLSRETFRLVSGGSDFDLGCFAADALGVQALDHLSGAVKNGPREDRLKAIRGLGKAEGGIDFLIEFFPRLAEERCRAEIVALVPRADAGRGVELALSALSDAAPAVRAAAVAALADHGDERAAGPLYALAEADSEPQDLRDRAKEALKHIVARHGLSSDGRLSLAGGEAEGGLSEAEERPARDKQKD